MDRRVLRVQKRVLRVQKRVLRVKKRALRVLREVRRILRIIRRVFASTKSGVVSSEKSYPVTISCLVVESKITICLHIAQKPLSHLLSPLVRFVKVFTNNKTLLN